MGVDEEVFLQHLSSLNIDTSGVSFAWLLDEDNEILNWFFNNISANNCLSAEEKAYYADLQDSGNVLDENELRQELDNIRDVYHDITTPSDSCNVATLEDARQRVQDLEEWIQLMEDQEYTRKRLMERNEEISRQLSKEKFDLTEALSIESAMLSRLTEECEKLVVTARDERLRCYNLMDDVLKICTGSKNSEEKLFFSQMPLEDYFTKTDLLATYIRHNVANQMNFFNSHDDAAISMQNDQKYSPQKINHDWKSAENKLMEICDKLREGVWCYVKSKAEMSGVMEQLKYIENYDISLCFDTCFEKVKYSGLVKVLEKDLEVLKLQKIPDDIHKFVDGQSERLVLGEMQIRYEKTKHMYDKLCSLVELSARALRDSEVAVMCVKRDQMAVENLYTFSMDLLNSMQAFLQSSKAREMTPRPPSSACFLLQTLMSLLLCSAGGDPSSILASSVDMCTAKLEKLEADIQRLEMEAFYTKFDSIKEAIVESNEKSLPMKKLIWDGPTDQPSVCNKALDAALYDVKRSNAVAEEDIKKVAKTYMEFKKITEQDSLLTNLWKWFLSDVNQIKLLRNKYQAKESKPIKPFKV